MKTIIKRKVFKMKKSIKDYLVILVGLIVLSFFFASCMSVEVQFDEGPLSSAERIANELAAFSNPFVFIDYEALPLGAPFTFGNFCFEDGTKMSATQFKWRNGIDTFAGHFKADNHGMAGFAGQDLLINNARVHFDFPITPDKVVIFYGEYGGNVNLMVNGVLRNVEDFLPLDGTTTAGVDIYVTETAVPGGVQGIIFLDGTINALEIGGQEFLIDHVGFKN